MELKSNAVLEMMANEAFIRRASQIDLPFMLKGSYVTRQYFENPINRIPADLDWVYMHTISDEQTARKTFSNWATRVTELELDDNVRFISFKENDFWRRIDYAMADDFPTVNTDIACVIDERTVVFGLDVSFNLDIEQPSVPLMYRPLTGNLFLIPNTVPISLQVSWKIHQTLVRPRFKDLFDLMHLVQHPSFDKHNLDRALQALINECYTDNVDMLKVGYFLNTEIEKLFLNNSIHEAWDFWRHNKKVNSFQEGVTYEYGYHITDVSRLPTELLDFLHQLRNSLENAGIGIHLFDCLPQPTSYKKRVTLDSISNETKNAIPQNDAHIEKRMTHEEHWPLFIFLRKLFGFKNS